MKNTERRTLGEDSLSSGTECLIFSGIAQLRKSCMREESRRKSNSHHTSTKFWPKLRMAQRRKDFRRGGSCLRGTPR